ncbi:MarR family transcriptional regulator [Planctomonas sp. JC2975]|uniref:MarR family winged helix-turn-helix transcriptional regulator n=1 Tax=Planctomonas sp. JC2975 TaxID=2729626 RepID=UPI00147406E5|nr:MarR family transcriptional regulator [Planctomonas sp. JC2975]NNC12489.1 MarR family transcriptional regulator [Planctomonas sp. JC2975]
MDPIDDLAMPFLLMSAFRGLVDAAHEELAPAGFAEVRPTHGFAMQAIGAGCTSVQLGERLGVSKQAATKTAGTLEQLGLISRERNPGDRRERILTPTPHGHEMLRRSAEAFSRELRRWRERVGDANIDVTLRTLADAPRGRRGPTDLSDWT